MLGRRETEFRSSTTHLPGTNCFSEDMWRVLLDVSIHWTGPAAPDWTHPELSLKAFSVYDRSLFTPFAKLVPLCYQEWCPGLP